MPNLPPIYTLGFHYSKWEKGASAERLLDYMINFEDGEFPLDVLWLDIPATRGNRYFTLDPCSFPEDHLMVLENELEATGKKLVIITDPHIKVDEDFFVWSDGTDLDGTLDHEGRLCNTFVKDVDLEPFICDCWPGQSQWIDYLNYGASKYWSSLYAYDKFEGTSQCFAGIWTDMNEPSVFNQPGTTMPKDKLHVTADGTYFTHNNIHNAYGVLMSRPTYQGLLQRDNH